MEKNIENEQTKTVIFPSQNIEKDTKKRNISDISPDANFDPIFEANYGF